MIGILAAVLLMFSCMFTTAHASTASSVTVNSLSLASATVKQSGSVVLNIGASISGVGVNRIDVYFTMTDGSNQFSSFDLFNNPNLFPDTSGNMPFTIWAPPSQTKGDYYMSEIDITDANGGVRKLAWDASRKLLVDSTDSTKTYTAPTLKVVGDEDVTAPVLTSLQLKTSQIGINGSAGIEFGFTEDGSGLSEVDIEMTDLTSAAKPVAHATDVYPTSLKTGTKTVYVYAGASPTAGNYTFTKITLKDKSGNKAEYSATSNAAVFANLAKGTLTIKNEVVDVTAPVVKNIRIVNNKVTKPGVITIQADIVEDGTGLKEFQVNLTGDAQNSHLSWYDYYPAGTTAVKTQTMTLKIGVDTEDAAGTYQIANISISDQAGNRTDYGFSQSDPSIASISTASTVEVVEENLPITVWTSLSNPKLIDQLNGMDDSSAAKLSDDTNLIPKAVFEALDGTNKTIDVYKDGIEWIFNGADINAEDIKDIDTTVQIKRVSGSEYGSSNDVVQIIFPNNGKLPGKVKMRFKLDYLTYLYHLSGDLHLYYSNNNLLNPEDTTFTLASDNYLEFYLTHNSTFIISANEITSKNVNSGTASDVYQSPDTGYQDTSYLYGNIFLIAMGIAAAAWMMLKKKKA